MMAMLEAFSPPPLLLIEAGSISEYTKEQESNMQSLSLCLHYCQSVVSLSSGSGNFTTTEGGFGKFVAALVRKGKRFYFTPFTEHEFSLYNDRFLKHQGISYKNLTNYNPLLLDALKDVEENESALSIINEIVRKYFASILETLKATNFEWVQDTLDMDLEMLYNASNKFELPKDRLDDYTESWVCAESITYIRKQSDSSFVLDINFPTYFESLRKILYECRDKIEVRSPIIDGLYFEAKVCRRIFELDIVYSKKSESLASQSDLKVLRATFSQHIDHDSGSAVQGLLDGVVHHLRPFHPVIDAVAYAKIDDIPWLFLIQVSTSDYKTHLTKSGVNDLKNTVQGCEKAAADESTTWLQYYQQRVPEEVSATCRHMYVYVSPKEFIEPKAEQLLCTYDLRSNSEEIIDNIYFGCILKDSESARKIDSFAQDFS